MKRRPFTPDRMNDERADRAEIGFNAFVAAHGNPNMHPDDYPLGDLLCNLMHMCDRRDTSFETELWLARMHYAAETDMAHPIDPKIEVIVIVRGGLVSGVVSNVAEIDLHVLDHDNFEDDEDNSPEARAEYRALCRRADKLPPIY